MTTPDRVFWRVIVGVRLAGLADVRADAVGPLGGRYGEPLLCLVLAREFPLTQ